MKLYRIEYLYNDELQEDEPRGGYMVVYSDEDRALEDAMESLSDEDATQVDKILMAVYGVTDEEVAFYLSWSHGNRDDLLLVPTLQKEMDAVVYDIQEVTPYAQKTIDKKGGE